MIAQKIGKVLTVSYEIKPVNLAMCTRRKLFEHNLLTVVVTFIADTFKGEVSGQLFVRFLRYYLHIRRLSNGRCGHSCRNRQ